MATVTIYPTGYTLGTNGANFTNPGNLYSDNATYATVTATSKNVTSQIYLETFNYSAIPAGSTITSITVNVVRKMSTTSSVQSVAIQAYKSTTAVGTKTTDTTEPSTDTLLSNANTGTWTYSDLANLRVLLENIRGNSTVACTISYDYVSATVVYVPTYTDAGAISQASTLSATGLVNIPATCSISQASTLEAVGDKSTPTANAYGTSKYGETTYGVPTVNSYTDSCSISQGSTLSASGFVTVSQSASISQASTLNALSFATRFGVSTISQGSTLNALSKVSMFGISTISQPSTLNALAKVLMFGSSSISQASTLTATSHATITDSCSIAQGSTLNAVGTVTTGTQTYTDSCSVTQLSTLDAQVYRIAFDSATIAQSSEVQSLGFAIGFGSCSISQSSSLDATVYRIAFGSNAISQGSSLEAIGEVTQGSQSYTDSCAVNQSSTIQASSYASIQALCSVIQSTSLVCTATMDCLVNASVHTVYALSASCFVSMFDLCDITQATAVRASLNAPLSQRYHSTVRFPLNEVYLMPTVQDGNIIVKFEGDENETIELSKHHREDVKL